MELSSAAEEPRDLEEWDAQSNLVFTLAWCKCVRVRENTLWSSYVLLEVRLFSLYLTEFAEKWEERFGDHWQLPHQSVLHSSMLCLFPKLQSKKHRLRLQCFFQLTGVLNLFSLCCTGTCRGSGSTVFVISCDQTEWHFVWKLMFLAVQDSSRWCYTDKNVNIKVVGFVLEKFLCWAHATDTLGLLELLLPGQTSSIHQEYTKTSLLCPRQTVANKGSTVSFANTKLVCGHFSPIYWQPR